jgi:hypothetical protein
VRPLVLVCWVLASALWVLGSGVVMLAVDAGGFLSPQCWCGRGRGVWGIGNRFSIEPAFVYETTMQCSWARSVVGCWARVACFAVVWRVAPGLREP